MRLIKMHIGLYRYIKQEYKKSPDKKKFWGGIIKAYFLAWKNEIKLLLRYLDKDYRKQLKEYKRVQIVQKDLQKALKLLEYIDVKLDKKGYNRTERRQFWRDFSKDSKLRTEIYQELAKEINNWRK